MKNETKWTELLNKTRNMLIVIFMQVMSMFSINGSRSGRNVGFYTFSGFQIVKQFKSLLNKYFSQMILSIIQQQEQKQRQVFFLHFFFVLGAGEDMITIICSLNVSSSISIIQAFYFLYIFNPSYCWSDYFAILLPSYPIFVTVFC
ncbi:OLC1v1030455C1 [Oldenlandia corymbosa var. corymbosa]|uniref:OLC1v1030455C1 n=1 Tax=Oldenlandia corymbosa var. corymbosa TaxID=529605 RepID=A0AAV1CJF6_OLDCO|nr:OLC1v1030455C1 [Oldenlandia corymbosa var. corymbosa]